MHIHFKSYPLFSVGNEFGKSYSIFFSLLQPKYHGEKCRRSPLGLGRDDPPSLSEVNGCAALFHMGAEGYLAETWAAALPSCSQGAAAAQRLQARRLLNCFLRGSDIKST